MSRTTRSSYERLSFSLISSLIFLSNQIVLEFKSQLRKLEHENADLRFLNTQYIHRLRSLEKESRQKDNKILELQEKNFYLNSSWYFSFFGFCFLCISLALLDIVNVQLCFQSLGACP